MSNYIPLSDCQHGYLYHFRARNFCLGVFNAQTNGFVGIREKFGNEYLFTELHWDADPMFGTVQPIELLEPCPIADLSEGEVVNHNFVTNAPLFGWLAEANERYAHLYL